MSLDLRGVRCPLSWAKAKLYLEEQSRGAEVELILDDPKGARDIPRAAEAEGYAVIDVVERLRERPHERSREWRILIHK